MSDMDALIERRVHLVELVAEARMNARCYAQTIMEVSWQITANFLEKKLIDLDVQYELVKGQ